MTDEELAEYQKGCAIEREEREAKERLLLAQFEIVPGLPWWKDVEELPPDIIGATIIHMGRRAEHKGEWQPFGGHLIIDYRPAGQDQILRAAFLPDDRGLALEEVVTLTEQPIKASGE